MSWRRFPHIARKLPSVGWCAITEWLEHRASSKGAALAFYTLFSLAPILVLVIAIAGLFFGKEAAQGELFFQLRGLVGSQGAEAIQLVLAGATNEEQGLLATIIAGALLLFGATSVFAELKSSLDEIWQLPPAPGSGIWDTVRTRLLSFGMVLVLGFLLLVSLVVSAALTVLEKKMGAYWRDAAQLLTLLNQVISFIVIATLFGVIYKMLPRIRLSWRDVVIGALGTAALFTLGKYAIGAYIGNSGVTDSFGAAGSLIALLLWVYYSAQIFFLGAEFARQYALQLGSLTHRAVRPPPPSPPPSPPPP
ncbi:YihY/virulence factor BrkB family protein [Pseudoduganella sp.]|uniref:YihY/virulence factor BrkB family protein n=1 Tax=Pseudoduganella sp. TaxID=1880898 RepID=UPI0035B2F47B